MKTATVEAAMLLALVAIALSFATIAPGLGQNLASATSDFQKKMTFQDKDEENTYKEALANELKGLYKEIKQLEKNSPNSKTLADKKSEFADLKAHMVELIKKYDPTANPTPYIEEETLEENARMWKETNGHYSDISQDQTATTTQTSWEEMFEMQEAYAITWATKVYAKPGYQAPCWYFPAATCNYEQSSYGTVLWNNNKTFHKLTEANHPWIIPYIKLKHPEIASYSWVDGIDISGNVWPNGMNISGYYSVTQANYERIFTGTVVYSTSGCGCTIPSGTDMSHLFAFGPI